MGVNEAVIALYFGKSVQGATLPHRGRYKSYFQRYFFFTTVNLSFAKQAEVWQGAINGHLCKPKEVLITLGSWES